MKKLITLFLGITISLALNGQTKLELNLVVGKTYPLSTTSHSTIIQEYNGQKMTMAIDLSGEMTFKVKEVHADHFLMDVAYTTMTMGMELANGSMEFSSANPTEGDMVSNLFSAMVNKTFQVKMSKVGKVLEVINLDRLVDDALASFGDISPTALGQAKAQMMQSFGTEAFKGNIELATAFYPENPVKKGDKWEVTTDLKGEFNAKVNNVYTLEKISEDQILIKGNAKIKTENGKFTASNGIEMDMDINGTMTSNIKVDKKSGWIISSEVVQDFSGTAEVKDTPQTPGGMTIPMTFKTTLTTLGI